MTLASGEKLVSLREAARILGVHHSTLSRAVKRGSLSPAGFTPGGWPRFRLSDIKQLQARGITGTAANSVAIEGADSLAPDEAGRLIGSTSVADSHEETLSALPDLARRLVGADFAAVTILDETGHVERMYYSGISKEMAATIGHPPEGRGVLGILGPEDAPLRLDKISAHPRSVGFPSNHPPMESLLGVRIGGLRTRAHLYVANGPGRSGFTLRDEDLVKALAGYARLALSNEELLARESVLRLEAQVAEWRLDTVIRSISAGVFVVNPEGTIEFANEEMRRISGLDLRPGNSRTDLQRSIKSIGLLGDKFTPDDLPLSRALVDRKPAGPTELLVQRPDGRRMTVLASASPVLSSEGELISAVAVWQDMTRSKELEQVKQDFFSMVTHDLRSPLATIKGIARSAQSEVEEGTPAARYLDEIDEEVDFLTELVSNLLDMSRLEAGVNILELETCHITDLLHDAVRRALRSRPGAGRKIEVEIAPGLPLLYADPMQIGRVLDNMLSNALKYSRDPVGIRSYADDGGRVVTEVTDRGVGIPAASLDSIYSKFFRVRQGSRTGREGAGLGLAVCKAIIEAHHGEVGVSSREREGSTFWFALPAQASARIQPRQEGQNVWPAELPEKDGAIAESPNSLT